MGVRALWRTDAQQSLVRVPLLACRRVEGGKPPGGVSEPKLADPHTSPGVVA